MTTVDWRRVEAVIFDLDGTLYAQAPLRRRMLGLLLGHCLMNPRDARLPFVLQRFRQCREALAEAEAAGIEELQFQRPAAAIGIDPALLRQLVHEWLEHRPLPYLAACRAPGAVALINRLRATGRPVAVFSDYPVAAKLRALGIRVDLAVAAVDPEIDRLKPHPRGLEVIQRKLGLPASACLLIGDRPERDGHCAARVGMPFLRKIWRAPETPGTVLDFFDFAATLP